MSPNTVRAIQTADKAIREWSRLRFFGNCLVWLNGGFGVADTIEAWGNNAWGFGILTAVNFFCAGFIFYRNIRTSKRLELWRQLRRTVMELDAARTHSKAVLHADQLDALLRDL